MIETEQYLQVGDIELRAKDIKTLLEEHNNMKQDIKRLKEEYMILQNASDEVEEEKDKEIERLNKENNDLRKLYQRTYKHLFEIGNDELARYFQAQIDECPTFYVEPIIDYLNKEE